MHSTTATSLTSGYRGVRGSYDVTKRRSLTSFGVQQPRDRGLCSSMSPISTRCDLFLGLEGIVASKTSSFQSSLTLKKSVAVVRGLFGGSLDHKTSLRYQVFEIVVDHQPRVDYYLLPAYKVTAMFCIYWRRPLGNQKVDDAEYHDKTQKESRTRSWPQAIKGSNDVTIKEQHSLTNIGAQQPEYRAGTSTQVIEYAIGRGWSSCLSPCRWFIGSAITEVLSEKKSNASKNNMNDELGVGGTVTRRGHGGQMREYIG